MANLFSKRNPLAAVATLAMLALPAIAIEPAAAVAQTAAATSSLEPLKITTKSGEHAFSVEVMRTEPERERGLMFRRSMPSDRGMLFDFKEEKPVMMWMKNTYLPLDMVFISRAGVVVHVAENAEPLSERIIPSGGPAYAVLELNAGAARSIDLKPGDKVANAMFAK